MLELVNTICNGRCACCNGSGGPVDDLALTVLRDERLDWRFKAAPDRDCGTVAEYLADRPALAEWGTPLLTLDAGALAHNLATMADWVASSGVALAPHGKTTMAPALWQRQLRAGAWGITLATVAQLRVARAFGVPRVMLAGSVLDPAALAWIGGQLDDDPGFSFVCWVDSVRSVELMDRALRASGGQRPVDVCVELGGVGGRTGARGVGAARTVADAVQRAPRLRLVGVAGYEGALAHDASAAALRTVDAYLGS